jgi:uncharacterized protein
MSLYSIMCRHESVRFQSSARANARILHWSDLHLWGLPWEKKRMTHWHEKMIEFAPDAIVITGDIADTRCGFRSWLHWCRDLSEICPIYWIRGNHDPILEADEIQKLIQNCRIYSVDENDYALHLGDGNEIPIMSWARWLQSPQKNAIVLIHNPRPIRPSQVILPVLILAGHLHGGQWVLWRDEKGAGWPPSLFYPWCADRWNLPQGHLIVSRGMGDSFPLRFRCPMEMVIIDIYFE